MPTAVSAPLPFVPFTQPPEKPAVPSAESTSGPKQTKGKQGSSPRVRKVTPSPRLTPYALRLIEDSIEALLTYHDQAVLHAQDPKVYAPPPVSLLQEGLPHGPIEDAFTTELPEGMRGKTAAPCAIIFRVNRTGARTFETVPAAFFLLRALCLFAERHFEPTGRGLRGPRSLPILADGFTFTRLLAGAEWDQEVRPSPNPSELYPWSLTLEPGHPMERRDRPDAIEAALREYDRVARAWEIETRLTASDYAGLLRGSFRLFDREHGHHFLSPLATNPVSVTAG